MFYQALEDSSYWTATTSMTPYPALADQVDVDVVVVGGGVTGVTAAHLLKQAGFRVALFERDRCGAGQTGRTTAHLATVPDVSFSKLVDRIGIDRTRRLWDAGFAALSRVRAEVRDGRIHCDFAWVRGCLHAPLEQDLTAARLTLSREAAVANALGVSATYVDQVAGIGRPGVWFEAQARLHPLRYLSVLLDRIDGGGSHIYERTTVDDIDASQLTVKANGITVAARYIVLATHVPPAYLHDGVITSAPPVDLSTSYVVSGTAPRGALDEGLYWEHRDGAYEYLRVDRQEHQDFVVFGGLDHVGGEAAATPDRFSRLERRLAQRVPGVRIEHRWSGQIAEAADGRPYIGEIADRVFAATGFGGNGMTLGTLAGMMAADAVRGETNPWSDLFDARRSSVLDGRWSPALTEAS